MALAPRDIPVTREMVHQWRKAFRQLKKDPTFTKKFPEYLQQQLDAMQLPDTMVSTPNHDDLGSETSLIDMILADMDSYPGGKISG